ncbi:large neutral amino acids transporter small subunit 1-like [Tubulanus polymorphus]|uniref:large neutral amino acids transporter small subunit 1-like n=1 Tax=Tubulanus polymorphus TaxID=672921 RepID=UPI003DA61EFF
MEADKDSPQSQDGDHVRLKRTLGLRNGICLIMGIIIGSGIFVSPKGVLEHTGSIGASLLLWTFCGFIALLGSFSYAEIGSVIPVSSGPYAYTLRAFGEIPAFMVMWMIVVVRGPVSMAILAITCGNYIIEPFFPLCDQQPEAAVKLIAIIAIIGTVALNCVSVKWATRLQDSLSFTKIIALAAIIIAGIVKLVIDYQAGRSSKFKEPFKRTNTNPAEWALGFYAGMFSYAGWYNLNYVVEEIKNPNRNLTLAIVISVPMVTFLYVMTNLAYFAVLEQDLVLESNAVAVTFGNKLFGVMAWCIPLLVALSTLGSLNGSSIVAPRVIFVAARRGHLPHSLALVSLRYVTPITACIFTGLLTVIIVIFSVDLYRLISYFSFLDMFMLIVPVIGLLHLRWKHPDIPRPVKVHNIVHLSFLFVSVVTLILPFYVDPLGTVYGILIVLTGLPAYWFGVTWKNKPAFIQKYIYYSTIGLQKLFFAAKTDAVLIETG